MATVAAGEVLADVDVGDLEELGDVDEERPAHGGEEVHQHSVGLTLHLPGIVINNQCCDNQFKQILFSI